MKADTSTSDRGGIALRSPSPSHTQELGAALGALLDGGEALTLTGPLGAGKTCLVKGLARGLDIDPREVTSPTFLLIHQLEGRRRLLHLDAYRAASSEVFVELGLFDLLTDDTVVAVEWADRVPDILPPDRLEIALDHAGESMREIRLKATGPRHSALLKRLRPPSGLGKPSP